MNTTILIIGAIVLVLGIIGLIANWAVGWMWVLIVLGIIGVIWGLSAKGQQKVG